MAGNRLLIFQSEAPVFLPHLLEVGLYHGAALPEEKDTAWHLGRPKADYLLFHCITGGLRIACRQKEYSLQAGCALLLDGKQAVSVEAQAGARVAAFRFRCEKGKPPLRVGRVNQVAHGPVQEALYTVLSAVDEPAEPLACNQLSLQFALLLYEWRGAAEYSLQAGCALLLDGKQAVSVEAQAGARVAAFRFRCEKGKPPLRVGRVNQVAHGPVQEALYTVLSAVDEPAEPLACNQLSLQFALLLYEWRGAAENRERKPTVSAYEAEIHEAVSYMRAHLDEKIQMSELAKGLHLSERNFRKCFTASIGVSPKAYLQKARLEHAKDLLRAGEQSISEISEAVGYYSQFQFSRDFKKEYGLTPSDYRGGGEVPRAKKAGNPKKK